VSSAEYRATAAGTLNLSTAVPVAGRCHVADAAGLLWSLHPAFTSNPTAQFITSGTGFSVTVRVLAEGRVQAAATLRRETALPASVQTVRRDGLASTLFVPAKTRPGAPAVVVIGGSEGGEETLTAAALSLIGYPALALGYFREPGLPRCLCDIPLGYFARAVHWLRAAFATVIMQELRTARDRAPYTNLYYPGAGHAAAGVPPYFPYSDIGSSGDVHGGSEQANALAAEQFWPEMIKFINNPWVPLK
jgi:Acyl-CoA thioester hydrolase/BAAT N-terminal region/BAAT / Acyl-CoA thioester hydrolase C terminal